MKLIHQASKTVILDHVRVADRPLQRAKGLLFTRELKKGHGLWLQPCNAIHMFGMRYAIDALFLDKQRRVVHKLENLKPNQISPLVWKAHSVVEMPAGSLERTSIEIEDQLHVAQ